MAVSFDNTVRTRSASLNPAADADAPTVATQQLIAPALYRQPKANPGSGAWVSTVGQLGLRARNLILESGRNLGRVAALLGALATPAWADGIAPHQSALLGAGSLDAPWSSDLSTHQLRGLGIGPSRSKIADDLAQVRAKLRTLTKTYPAYAGVEREVEGHLAVIDTLLKADLSDAARDPRAVLTLTAQLIGMDQWLHCAQDRLGAELDGATLPSAPASLQHPLLCEASRLEGALFKAGSYPDFEAILGRILEASKNLKRLHPEGNVACLEACVSAYRAQVEVILQQAQRSGGEYLPDAGVLLAELEAAVMARLQAVEGWDSMVKTVRSAEHEAAGQLWSFFFAKLLNTVMPFDSDWYNGQYRTLGQMRANARWLGDTADTVRELYAGGLDPLRAQALTQEAQELLKGLEERKSEEWGEFRDRVVGNVILGIGAASILLLVYLFADDYRITRRNDRAVDNAAPPDLEAMRGPGNDP